VNWRWTNISKSIENSTLDQRGNEDPLSPILHIVPPKRSYHTATLIRNSMMVSISNIFIFLFFAIIEMINEMIKEEILTIFSFFFKFDPGFVWWK